MNRYAIVKDPNESVCTPEGIERILAIRNCPDYSRDAFNKFIEVKNNINEAFSNPAAISRINTNIGIGYSILFNICTSVTPLTIKYVLEWLTAQGFKNPRLVLQMTHCSYDLMYYSYKVIVYTELKGK